MKLIVIILISILTQAKEIHFNVISKSYEPIGECQLEGIVSLPKNPKAIVLIIHGSGAHNKDGKISKYKPYKDIANQLFKLDIAVVRYDKRSSIKDCAIKMNSPSFRYSVFVDDARNVIAKLSDFDSLNKIPLFLLGHSQGVQFANIISNSNKNIQGQILMAGLGHYKFDETLFRQLNNQLKHPQISDQQRDQINKLMISGKSFFNKIRNDDFKEDEFFFGAYAGFWSDYLKMTDRSFKLAKSSNKPSLVLFGKHDTQVTLDDYKALKQATEAQKFSDSHAFEDLGHLMTKHGEFVVDSRVSAKISSWINAILKSSQK